MRFVVASLAWILSAASFADISTPKQALGFDICDDFQLANYAQLTDYWTTLAKQSKRIIVQSIGTTEEGRSQQMAIISDPANIKNLEKIRALSQRIAESSSFGSDSEFQKAVAKMPAVVWIDGGLHANEVLGAQQLIETAYQLVSREDAETRRILKDVVILLVHANPDGMDLVSNWFMRKPAPDRSLANIPRLYQKYAGHDNNRDFFQMNLAETRNLNKILYRTWFPQIVYNHHQSAPSGTIMYIPPFRNPFNFHVDPLIQNGTDLVGTQMHHRLIGEGKGGTVGREGASFSAWWNGGLRTMTYFHNMVGILTETWGSPNPTQVPFLKARQIPTTDLPFPIEPKLWRLKDSLAYEMSANYAILDYASRFRDRLLFMTYRAAKNSVERGNKDHWTRYPSRITALGSEAITKPELRDARAYEIPRGENDAIALQEFIVLLQQAGIKVQSSNSAYVVLCNQAYRPHILDMFEAQDHPNDFLYPGGPPIAPYDNAGYTPAFTMGISFKRLLDAPDTASLTPLKELERAKNESTFPMSAGTDLAGYMTAIQILRSGRDLYWSQNSFSAMQSAGHNSEPKKIAHSPRIGLLDRFGGSMPSGWTRWLLDRFGLAYTVLFPEDIESKSHAVKSLVDTFDVIIVPSDINIASTRSQPNPFVSDPTVPESIFRTWGAFSADRSATTLKQFVQEGGDLVVMGSACRSVATALGLPVENPLVEKDAEGRLNPLPSAKYYIPGSVLRVSVETESVLTRGVKPELDILFDNSPVFLIKNSDTSITPLATFKTETPLRSGWAWGQDKLKDSVAMLDAKLGKGHVVLYGPEVNFRGQTWGSFKLIFNAIFRSAATE